MRTALSSPWRVLAVLLLLAAIVCGVIAAVTWDDFGFEGAYLNRSIGAPAYSGVYSEWGSSDGPRILVGVAIGLAASAVMILATSILQSRRRSPAAPGV
jgi:cytochrome c biogenesis factor